MSKQKILQKRNSSFLQILPTVSPTRVDTESISENKKAKKKHRMISTKTNASAHRFKRYHSLAYLTWKKFSKRRLTDDGVSALNDG